MNKKIGIFVVFVLLAGAVFLSGCTQEEVGAKLNRNLNGNVDANSCKADGSCEMYSATIRNLILEDKTIRTKAGHDLTLESGANDVRIEGNLLIEGYIASTDLNAGQNEDGNAYLCVNSEGVIYRSHDRCV